MNMLGYGRVILIFVDFFMCLDYVVVMLCYVMLWDRAVIGLCLLLR